MSESVTVGALTFAVRRSAHRRTFGVSVGRGGELVIDAPAGCADEEIVRMAERKSLWVHTTLARKRLLMRPSAPREFVTGEGFAYLGRSYRLKLIDPPGPGEPQAPLRLHHGRFLLRRDERPRGHQHFVRWYATHGQPWLERRLRLLALHFAIDAPAITVRDLGFRWASCTGRGTILVHWRVLTLPPRIIDFVLVHELAHLRASRHGPEFRRLMDRAMPDHESRRRWLVNHRDLL